MDRENNVFDDKLRTIVTVLKIPLIMNVTFFLQMIELKAGNRKLFS